MNLNGKTAIITSSGSGIGQATAVRLAAEGVPDSEDKSGFGPMHRMANAEEIASAVTFLFSDEASYVNGVLMPVDGGLAV